MSQPMRIATAFAFFLFVFLLTRTAYADTAVSDQAQIALETAIKDAADRAQQAKGQRFSFTSRIETGDEDNPLIEFSFDPRKPYADRVTILHPTMEENPKALKKILKQKQETLEKRKKEGTEATQDHDLIFAAAQEMLGNESPRFEREENGEYIYSFSPSVLMQGDDDEDKARAGDKKGKGKGKSGKVKKDSFASHMNGELFVDMQNKRISSIRVFSTEPFKPAAIAKIKSFEMIMKFAPAWPDGPMVTTHQEVTVAGKAMFKKFEQHTSVDNFGFEKH